MLSMVHVIKRMPSMEMELELEDLHVPYLMHTRHERESDTMQVSEDQQTTMAAGRLLSMSSLRRDGQAASRMVPTIPCQAPSTTCIY